MIAAICSLFGGLLNFLYNLLGENYGFALIGFTLIVNLILLPLTLKQQKSTTQMQAIQPELSKIQEMYKNDKEKLNAETMKLYQTHNINPMSGCLPLLIQLPIILILYQVIIKPLTYMQGLKPEQIQELRTIVGAPKTMMEVELASKASELAELGTEIPEFFKPINFEFLKVFDLGAIPSISNPSVLWLIPILAGITTFGLTWLTTRQANAKKTEAQKQKEKENAMGNQMQTMSKIMPIFTVVFAFRFAAGIGFYWIMNNVFKMIQQLIVNKMLEKESKNPLVIEANSKSGKKKKK